MRTAGFGPAHLPYGVFAPSAPAGAPARIGVRLGAQVVDVAGLARLDRRGDAQLFAAGSLNPLLAAGPARWAQVRAWLLDRAPNSPAGLRFGLEDVTLAMPVEVADYVDFYASRVHAENAGRILRPDTPPLTPNWLHQPIGYHGRAGTVVVSGTDVVRPCGQLPPAEPGGAPSFGASTQLDFEAEVAFVLGGPTGIATPVPIEQAERHLFGVALLDDWSARDIQSFEARPLGPFLGKSFMTSMSAWVTPLSALEQARADAPVQDPEPLPYLRAEHPWSLDIGLTVLVNGHPLAHPSTRALYWTPAQMLAHLTVNGAGIRAGDLFASGTVSGPDPHQLGCLLELSEGGRRPIPVGAEQRTWLRDGDTVTLLGTARGPDANPLTLGEVTGTVRPAQH